MAIALTFWALALLSCGYAAAYGGGTGRWGASLFLLAVTGTVIALWPATGWVHANVRLFLVDGVYFLALFILAVRSRRYWPIWSAAFQLLATLTHVAKMIDPAVLPRLYRGMEGVWAIPMLITMVAGVAIDRAAGLDRQDRNPAGDEGHAPKS